MVHDLAQKQEPKQSKPRMSAKKASMGTFQPLRHRSGTMRDRLHNYTKRTLGAGGSMNEAVSSSFEFVCIVSTAFRFVGVNFLAVERG